MTDAELNKAIDQEIRDAVTRLHQAFPHVVGTRLADRLAMRAMQMCGCEAPDVRRLIGRARYDRSGPYGMPDHVRRRWKARKAAAEPHSRSLLR
jgi:hypothetical protein